MKSCEIWTLQATIRCTWASELSTAGKRPATSTNRKKDKHHFFFRFMMEFLMRGFFHFMAWAVGFLFGILPALLFTHTQTWSNHVKSISIFWSWMVFPSQHCPATIKIHSKTNRNNMKLAFDFILSISLSLSLPLTYPMVSACITVDPQLSVASQQLPDSHSHKLQALFYSSHFVKVQHLQGVVDPPHAGRS